MSLLVVLLVCLLVWLVCNAIIPTVNFGTAEAPRSVSLGPIIALIVIIAYLTGSWGTHTFRLY